VSTESKTEPLSDAAAYESADNAFPIDQYMTTLEVNISDKQRFAYVDGFNEAAQRASEIIARKDKEIYDLKALLEMALDHLNPALTLVRDIRKAIE
jgi:hypothetical protein